MPMILLFLVLLLCFGVFLLLAAVVFKGSMAIVSGVVSLGALIAACVIGSRIQKHIIRMYPLRARMMLDAHLEPKDGDLVWVYGMTTPGALTNLLAPFNTLSRSFLLGLTRRRLLLLTTTDRLAQELAFRSIPFEEIKNASVEACSDPYGLGLLAAKKGLMLRFELQDGSKCAIGSAYDFPAFPPHKDNLEKIASFLRSQGFRSGE